MIRALESSDWERVRDDGAFVMAGWLAVRVEWSEEE